MEGIENLQLFEDQPIRTAWNETEEEWYFSIVDVVGILTKSEPQQLLESTKKAAPRRGK